MPLKFQGSQFEKPKSSSWIKKEVLRGPFGNFEVLNGPVLKDLRSVGTLLFSVFCFFGESYIFIFQTKLSCKVHKYLHKTCCNHNWNHPIVDWNIQGDPYPCNLGTNANNFGDLQYYLVFPNWYNSKERHFANANCPPKQIQ